MYLVCNICFRLAGFILYLFLKIENKVINKSSKRLLEEGNIIVSLTTFPARISTVWMVIESLFNQSVQPREIRLYLSKEEFPCQDRQLPKSLLKYVGLGLSIIFVDRNIMPHIKYVYAFQDILLNKKDYLVITVDDDMYYRKDMVEHLLKLHKLFPNCVCANSSRTIKVGSSYNNWINEAEAMSPSHKYLALGVGGVLYPVKLFTDKRMFDYEMIRKYCLRADDLWLKAFELINNIPVVTGDLYISFIDIIGTQAIALSATNTDDNSNENNNTQWKSLNELFKVDNLLDKV